MATCSAVALYKELPHLTGGDPLRSGYGVDRRVGEVCTHNGIQQTVLLWGVWLPGTMCRCGGKVDVDLADAPAGRWTRPPAGGSPRGQLVRVSVAARAALTPLLDKDAGGDQAAAGYGCMRPFARPFRRHPWTTTLGLAPSLDRT